MTEEEKLQLLIEEGRLERKLTAIVQMIQGHLDSLRANKLAVKRSGGIPSKEDVQFEGELREQLGRVAGKGTLDKFSPLFVFLAQKARLIAAAKNISEDLLSLGVNVQSYLEEFNKALSAILISRMESRGSTTSSAPGSGKAFKREVIQPVRLPLHLIQVPPVETQPHGPGDSSDDDKGHTPSPDDSLIVKCQ